MWGGMGFKDLRCFNLAILAKEGWRLHHNPNALLTRVLRAYHFRVGCFLNASLGHNPSWGWSIFEAKINLICRCYMGGWL